MEFVKAAQPGIATSWQHAETIDKSFLRQLCMRISISNPRDDPENSCEDVKDLPKNIGALEFRSIREKSDAPKGRG